jgi:GNAT superfamily N-acetyltransferase
METQAHFSLHDIDRGIAVKRANVEDLDGLVGLFEGYRQFYRQPSDTAGARQFLLDRFRYNQSVVFIAFKDKRAVGFTQLYPSFSSGSLAQIFILNDLFVVPEMRRFGVGSTLLASAAEYARQVGALRLTLSTEMSNTAAQSLYEKCGWKRDSVFCVYTFTP